MKKLILLLFIPLIILSCQKRAKDIKVDELNTPCEFADAFYIIFKEIEDLVEPLDVKNKNYEQGYKSINDIPKPIRTDYIKYGDILDKMEDRLGDLKIREKDLENCDKWNKAMLIVDEIEDALPEM